MQSTLVHELTHVLQDQHFDLEAKTKEVEDDSAASSASDALVEGDARRIESEWRNSLAQEAQAVVEALQEPVEGLRRTPPTSPRC